MSHNHRDPQPNRSDIPPSSRSSASTSTSANPSRPERLEPKKKRRARIRSRHYAPRRVPQGYAPAYARAKLVPLVPALIATVAVGIAGEATRLPESLREQARKQAQFLGGDISQRSQRIFFDEPGLDTLFVRGLARTAKLGARIGRTYLQAQSLLNKTRQRIETFRNRADHNKGNQLNSRTARIEVMLERMPRRGFEALMTGMLTMGEQQWEHCEAATFTSRRFATQRQNLQPLNLPRATPKPFCVGLTLPRPSVTCAPTSMTCIGR